MVTRQPIIAVVGHIDHGKTSILDSIRGSTIAQKEAGKITQHIGATELPMDAVKKVIGPLLSLIKTEVTLPGFLMIDTPGHEAFTNLRKRGGSISDIAILVVDVNEGFKAQTREALEILRQFKVPFVIAANKVDLVHGWKTQNKNSFLQSLKEQDDFVKEQIDEKLYKLVISLADYNINAERFDRIDDYTKQIAIVPTSGMTGEGISELLMVLTGLAQKYLEQSLNIEVTGPARGSIIEIKEEKGLGKTADVVIYAGTLDVGDTIVTPGLNEMIVTKVRALLKPSPLKELREKSSFDRVTSVTAAAGIKVSAHELDKAVAGMPIWEANTNEEIEAAKKELRKEIEAITTVRTEEGVIVKADTVGALEALSGLFEKINLPVRRANIGDLTRTDIVEAADIGKSQPLLGCVFVFNAKTPKELLEFAKNSNVKVFSAQIIYTLFESYQEWKSVQLDEKRKKANEKLTWPGKVRLMKGYVFRQSNPAVVGVEIEAGRIRTKTRLIRKDGKEIGEIKEIQHEGKNVTDAKQGTQVAISIPGVTVGRQINEGDELYIFVPRTHLEIIENEFGDELSGDDLRLIHEFKEIIK
ncbi:MAG TPA: translation initiation factor IF-2 [Candidatus Woesearchaeota archaeon]|nr:translation initiation factor IF-2 [Candidatus Woesearchaeota archaeon]